MNTLVKKLCQAGYGIIDYEELDDDMFKVAMHLPPIVFTVEGDISTRLLLNVARHPDDNYDDEINHILQIITMEVEVGPTLRIVQKLPTVAVEIGEAFGLSTQTLDKVGNIHYEIFEWLIAGTEYWIRRNLNDVRGELYDSYVNSCELLNGQDIKTYIDPQLTKRYLDAKTAHEMFNGVYGLDPVELDCPSLEDSDMCYAFVIYAATLCDDDLALANDYLKYFICRQEQIAISEPSSEERLTVGDDFDKWFMFYREYFSQQDEAWKDRFITAYRNHEDLSPFAPTGDWRKA